MKFLIKKVNLLRAPQGLRLLFLISVLSAVAAISAPSKEVLVVYTYDSFLGKGTLGDLAKQQFEKQTGYKIRFVPFGSAGEALNQVLLEGASTAADIVVGIDGGLKARAEHSGLFRSWQNGPAELEDSLKNWDAQNRFIPFDYGFLALVYDARRTQVTTPSLSLKDLAQQKARRKKIIVEDPRTSSLGLGFLISTHVMFGNVGVGPFWKDFSRQLATISPGWSGAYSLFLKKESEFVLSYTTSPAYHIENEGTDAFHAVLFDEGNYRQVETVGLLKKSKRVRGAQAFLRWLLSESTQSQLPKMQWMYPARKGVPLPKSFDSLPQVKKPIDPPADWDEAMKKGWLRDWEQWLAQSS